MGFSGRRKQHKLTFFYKLTNKYFPKYLSDLIPENSYNSRSMRSTVQMYQSQFRIRTEAFRNSTLPSAIILWNNIDKSIRDSPSPSIFKTKIFKLHAVNRNKLFQYGNRKVQIIMAQLRMNFSDLNAHLFQHYCVDNPLCPCQKANETVAHYLFDCELFEEQRHVLFESLYEVLSNHDIDFTEYILLHGSPDLSMKDNLNII